MQPDLVLLDYHLPHGDGLQLCHRIKQRIPAPRVIVFSAYAGPALTLPARLAKADGLLDKGVPARDLFEAIRLVNRGERLLEPVSRALLQDAEDAAGRGGHATAGDAARQHARARDRDRSASRAA